MQPCRITDHSRRLNTTLIARFRRTARLATALLEYEAVLPFPCDQPWYQTSLVLSYRPKIKMNYLQRVARTSPSFVPMSSFIPSYGYHSFLTTRAFHLAPSPSFHDDRSAISTHRDQNSWYGTTILCVRKNGKVCMIGDGQVSMGNMIIKPNAKKLRRIFPKSVGGRKAPSTGTNGDTTSEATTVNGGVIVGFAGSTADAFTLLERLEGKIDEYPGQLLRSCVELAKGWRTDKYLRRLEASLLVADDKISLEITGLGDVLESHDSVLAVGSGSPFAIAAARALQDIPELSAEQVARKAMDIASDMCVYTNKSFVLEIMDSTAVVPTCNKS